MLTELISKHSQASKEVNSEGTCATYAVQHVLMTYPMLLSLAALICQAKHQAACYTSFVSQVYTKSKHALTSKH